jgi:hypothetical protein
MDNWRASYSYGQLQIGNLLVDKKRFVVMWVSGDESEVIHFPRKELVERRLFLFYES